MLSVLIALLISTVLTFVGQANEWGTGWTTASGLLGLIVGLLLMGLYVRKRTMKINNELQEFMTNAQKRMTHKVNQFQSKPGGNYKLLQRQIEADQKAASLKALECIEAFEPLRKWNLLMGRQISTMRMQFLYQLKEFKQVDEILAIKSPLQKPLMMEPVLVCMKMARQFKNNQVDAAAKSFKRHVKWFRGSRSTLLYGTLSWIYVKSGDLENAQKLLAKGKDATGDEALTHNWEQIANGNTKKYTNTGIGEEWFSLYLENPPAPKQQRMRTQGRGF